MLITRNWVPLISFKVTSRSYYVLQALQFVDFCLKNQSERGVGVYCVGKLRRDQIKFIPRSIDKAQFRGALHGGAGSIYIIRCLAVTPRLRSPMERANIFLVHRVGL